MHRQLLASVLSAVVILLGAGAPALHAQPPAASDAPARPNILYIMADDHAAHAISCYGSRINHTPNLDRLAAQGMRFTNAFCTNSLCSPVRAVVLTGQYSHLNGVMDNSTPLPNNARIVPMALGESGYQTAIIGKWHLHRNPTGFDHWDILPGQGIYKDPQFITDGKKHRETGYVTDITFDKAMDWMRARDKSKPFVLYCHLKPPHREWTPDEKHATLYADTDIPTPATFDDDYATRTAASKIQTMTIEHHLTKTDVKADPPEGMTGHDLKVWKYERFIKDYLRCIASIDDNMGRLLTFLDEQKLTDNTIVIYTSDQGFFLGDHGWFDKRFMYEESLRSPLIVRYPPEIKPGTVCDDLVLNIDYAPTFLDYAGVNPAAMQHELQGASLRPIFKGEHPSDWRDAIYYHYYESTKDHTVPKHYGVRTHKYKLMRFYELPGGDDAQWELYDLEKDPHELKNLYKDPAYAEVITDLKARLRGFRNKYKDDTGPDVPQS